MPTQEERLVVLERAAAAAQKFQKAAAAHIRETEENTTILLGVIRDQGRDIKRVVERLDTIDARLSYMEDQFSEFKALLTDISARLPEKS